MLHALTHKLALRPMRKPILPPSTERRPSPSLDVLEERFFAAYPS